MNGNYGSDSHLNTPKALRIDRRLAWQVVATHVGEISSANAAGEALP